MERPDLLAGSSQEWISIAVAESGAWRGVYLGEITMPMRELCDAGWQTLHLAKMALAVATENPRTWRRSMRGAGCFRLSSTIVCTQRRDVRGERDATRRS